MEYQLFTLNFGIDYTLIENEYFRAITTLKSMIENMEFTDFTKFTLIEGIELEKRKIVNSEIQFIS